MHGPTRLPPGPRMLVASNPREDASSAWVPAPDELPPDHDAMNAACPRQAVRPTRSPERRPWLPGGMSALIGAGLLGLAGCGSPEVRPAAPLEQRTFVEQVGGKLTLQELDQLTFAFADRYGMAISSAVDRIKQGNPDPAQRRIAHRIKLNGVLAVNDIVSGGDPYSEVLDLLVAVTLQAHVWIDDGRAVREFGERAPILIGALQQTSTEIWQLASRALTQEQLEAVDLMLNTWSRQHSDVEQVEFVKFDNFSGARAAGMVGELRSGGGLLAPLSETNQELKEYRRMAERAFWYSKRAPGIAGIQAEAATNEILAAPEIASLITSVKTLTATADRVGGLAATLPAQIVAEVDARQPQVMAAIEAVKQLVGMATALSADLRSTIVAVDTLNGHTQPPPGTPPGRPFDVTEYTAMLAKTQEVLLSLSRLAGESERMTTPERLKPLTAVADERMERIFWYVFFSLLWLFVLAVSYRLVSTLISRRIGARP